MQRAETRSFVKFALTYGIRSCPKETARIFVRTVQERTKNAIFVAISDEDKITGYAAMRKLPPKYTFEKDIKCDKYIVGPIFVRAEYRKCGVGKVILDRVIEDIRLRNNKAYVYAYIRKNNIPSQALFSKCGFLNIGYMHKLKRKYYLAQEESMFFVFRLKCDKEG